MAIRLTQPKDKEPVPTSPLTVDPNVRGGVPCIGSGHWPIALLIEKLASGANLEALTKDYPDLTMADIHLALRVSAWVMRDPAINWPELNLPGIVDFQDELREWQDLDNDSLDDIDNL